MNLNFENLKQNEAETIATWNYPEDYQWTTLGKNSENEFHLLSEKHRGNYYYSLFDVNELIGYFSLNDSIRKEYGALQLVIKPELCNEENEKIIVETVIDFIKYLYPECKYINAICFSNQEKAMEIYEECGFENKGLVVAHGHDMQTYEQEGFDEAEDLKIQLGMYILSYKIR